jgi:hypothetical protein
MDDDEVSTSQAKGPEPRPLWSFSGSTIRTLSGFDPKLIPSIAESFHDLASLAPLNLTGVTDAAKTISIFPSVTPQIAEALNKVSVATFPTSSVAAEALANSPVFGFTKMLDELDLSTVTATQVFDSLQPLNVSKIFQTATTSVTHLPMTTTADLAADFDRRAEQAVALAEVEEVADIVDSLVGFGPRLKAMTPPQRRALALDVVTLVAAFLLLAAWLTQSSDDPRNPATGVAEFLACAAMYIRVYWRVIGKLG